MKNKGFIFIEIIMVMGLISFIILPLIILTNKNINRFNYIRENQELQKLSYNLEIIFLKILRENRNISDNYILIKNDRGDFILKKNNKIITRIREVKIYSKVDFFIKKRIIFHNDKEIGFLLILILKNKNKTIKKVLTIWKKKDFF